ncbi:hypothetical protein C7D74_32955, partial [Klebsiella pneumoniae]
AVADLNTESSGLNCSSASLVAQGQPPLCRSSISRRLQGVQQLAVADLNTESSGLNCSSASLVAQGQPPLCRSSIS